MPVTPLSDEQRNLVKEHLGLVGAFVRRYCGPGLDRDDLYQSCAIALMSAVQGWKPDRGELSTWAFFGMRAVFQQSLRRRCLVHGRHPQPRALYLAEQFEADGLTLEERLSDPEAVPVDVEADTLRQARAVLPRNSQHREILLRRAQGDTLQEIGKDMNLTRERVRQIEARALETARRRAS